MGSERELTSNSDMTAVESSLDLQRLLLQVSSKAREAIQYVKLDGLSVSEAAARSGRVQTSVFGRVKRDHRWLRPDRAGTKKTCSLRCKINQRQLSWRGRIGLLIEEDCLDVSVAGDNVVADRWHIEHGRVPDRVHDRKWIGPELRRERIEIRSNNTTL